MIFKKLTLFLIVFTILIGGFVLGKSVAKTNSTLEFTIDEVYDGDTIYITFTNVPPILGEHIGIRLLGIDTPEIRDSNLCLKNMAKISRDTLLVFVSSGKTITLANLKRDKYFRLDGDFLIDGKSAVQHMLDSKRAVGYTGEGPKPVWKCDMEWFKK